MNAARRRACWLGLVGCLAVLGACRRPGPVARIDGAATAQAPKVATARRLPRIDIHTHLEPACFPGMVGCGKPDAIDRAVGMMKRWGVDGMVNLSGMYPGPKHLLEMQLQSAQQAGGHVIVFANANFKHVLADPRYGETMARDLEESKRLGAVGLKIPKGLGLGYPAPGGRALLKVDDPGLDPLFEKAGELGMPVLIHVGDPKAFWLPVNPQNERWDELGAHPDWAFTGKPPYGDKYPSWQELYDALERRVARHPKTIFIGAHFGNDPEDPRNVGRMFDKHPNFYADTAARVPEIGRQPAGVMRAFFEKYQDRILFGTDTGISAQQEYMMYGSNGPLPPTLADEERFFKATWRYFETTDTKFESPTPIQGRWTIDGVGLPESVLRKIYFENAARLLKWRPPLFEDAAP